MKSMNPPNASYREAKVVNIIKSGSRFLLLFIIVFPPAVSFSLSLSLPLQ